MLARIVRLLIVIGIIVSSAGSTARASEWTKQDKLVLGYAQFWEKRSTGKICTVALDIKKGGVLGLVLRGTITERKLDGQWHMATYWAANVHELEKRGFALQEMHGNMVTGLEMLDLKAFHRLCGEPPDLTK